MSNATQNETEFLLWKNEQTQRTDKCREWNWGPTWGSHLARTDCQYENDQKRVRYNVTEETTWWNDVWTFWNKDGKNNPITTPLVNDLNVGFNSGIHQTQWIMFIERGPAIEWEVNKNVSNQYAKETKNVSTWFQRRKINAEDRHDERKLNKKR